MKKKYYKCKNGKYYTKYTRQEIHNLIDYNDFNTLIPFLKDMNYPAVEKEFNNIVQCNRLNLERVVGKYISIMKLFSYKNFTYNDSQYFKGENK